MLVAGALLGLGVLSTAWWWRWWVQRVDVVGLVVCTGEIYRSSLYTTHVFANWLQALELMYLPKGVRQIMPYFLMRLSRYLVYVLSYLQYIEFYLFLNYCNVDEYKNYWMAGNLKII